MTSERHVEVFAEDLGRQLARRISEAFTENILDAVAGYQSPIEKLMGLALQYALASSEWFGDYDYSGRFHQLGEMPSREDSGAFLAPPPSLHGALEIWPQVPVGKYKADFIVQLLDWRNYKVPSEPAERIYGFAQAAIECDGHDHHNLTKEQALHDRGRDREFQARGLLILRYPGSEIFKSPLKCAVDALSIVQRRARDPGAHRIFGAPT